MNDNMITPFTKRHRRAIFEEGTLKVGFPKIINKRIYKKLQQFNETWMETTETNMNIDTDLLEKSEQTLLIEYGYDKLTINGEEATFNEFVLNTYPSQVLDVVEVYYHELEKRSGNLNNFVKHINKVFVEEGEPWRLCQGQFFKVDWDFFQQEITNKTHDLLAKKGFEGAYEEFKKARVELQDQEYKDAIHWAGKSFESTLKTLLDENEGNADYLLNLFKDSGHLSDIPEGCRGGFRSQVLMALPFLRNNLGSHGDGKDSIEIPKEYARLALYIAGALIIFLLQKQFDEDILEILNENEEDNKEEFKGDEEDWLMEEDEEFDVPF